MTILTMTMDRDEYRQALTHLGLAQEEVGRLLDVGGRTARRWASGEVEVPGPVEMHIRLWLERPELLGVVRQIAARRDSS
ncbi:MAG: hypothetical protein APF80_09885 [Alphaproteobacteria bacterium BRH_c36]|nr:MAG: hypothetical protein APF80_09885 [Alphaproteobacteria bacterium BRH_c36]